MKNGIRIMITALAVGLLSVSFLAAEGVQERTDGSAGTVPAPGVRPYYSAEQTSISGTVELSASGVEVRTEDGESYELMYPRYLAEGLEIESGDNVSVEGFLVPGPRWETAGDRKYLHVEKVTIDGEVYDPGTYAYGYGMQSGPGMRGGGMRGGPGRGGYGMKGRSGYGPGAYGSQQGPAYGPGMQPSTQQGNRAYRW